MSSGHIRSVKEAVDMGFAYTFNVLEPLRRLLGSCCANLGHGVEVRQAAKLANLVGDGGYEEEWPRAANKRVGRYSRVCATPPPRLCYMATHRFSYNQSRSCPLKPSQTLLTTPHNI